MKKIWDIEKGVLDTYEEHETEVVAAYVHSKMYFIMIREKATGELISGWIKQGEVEDVAKSFKLKKEDFIEISDEEIFDLISKKK